MLTNSGAHPLALAHQAAVDVARAQEQILSRTDLPRVYVQSSVFARGSGANPDGQFDGGVSGLGFDRANWVAGVQVVFPNAFDFASLRARKAAAAASARTETALLDETQARARYQAGLASIGEVADAQSLLAQAEVQDQLARVDVWRALLAQASAQGTLAPFVSLVTPSPGVR